jgi:MoaA/NifB/PqqE/SkfB family radical SAM enzyme
MVKEWKDSFNSFNSVKGLTYIEYYKAIEEWKEGKRTSPLPPIEVSLDPIHACQLQCSHCNASRYLDTTKDTDRRMKDEHLMILIKFLANWKVKGICFGGGGEPTLHTQLWEALLLSKQLGLENSIATNGINLKDENIDIAVETCRWIGVSVDAATKKTYQIGRKMNVFNKAIINIEKLTEKSQKLNTNCDIAFKFLIFDYNQHEIYKACKLAKNIGVKDFHARPADFRHQGLGEFKKNQNIYNIKLIEKQFKKCHELATEDFRVFTVVHKFNEDYTPRRKFSQCYASPICIQLCADGWVYLCPDCRHMEGYKLGRHDPNPEEILKLWGSQRHYDLVFKEGAQNCNSRCTFSPYNEQCERLVINKDDPMCLSFV